MGIVFTTGLQTASRQWRSSIVSNLVHAGSGGVQQSQTWHMQAVGEFNSLELGIHACSGGVQVSNLVHAPGTCTQWGSSTDTCMQWVNSLELGTCMQAVVEFNSLELRICRLWEVQQSQTWEGSSMFIPLENFLLPSFLQHPTTSDIQYQY